MPDSSQSDALGMAELRRYREPLLFFARRALLPGPGHLVQKSEWRARQ